MKNWLKHVLVAKVLNSRKFLYTLSAICVPLLMNHLGLDEETSENVFWALCILVGAQGVADIKK
tara:strand:+ start:1365 stop:1556 length:192 start_codon:yes stop_codon:yes gene_type:complete